MNQTSISALLQRFESEFQTADGRTVQVCRDSNGSYWVVDGAERVVSLSEFASDGALAARQLCKRERAKALREFAVAVKRAFARVATAFRPGPPAVHA